jgi:large subunit ribosomal protein L16
VAVLKPGMIMFEIDGVEDDMAREALHLAAYKLPIKSKIISKNL